MTDHPVHPAASLFPPMDEKTYAGFKADIEERGQLEPVAIWCGQLLDGRNRWRACKELGIIPLTTELPQATDPVAYVISANLHRRHLDESQRGMVGARIANLERGSNRYHQKVDDVITSSTSSPVSAQKAADLMSVHKDTIQRAKKVISSGVPALVAAVDAGEVSLHKAVKIADLPAEEQPVKLKEVKEKKRGGTKKAAEPSEPTNGEIKLQGVGVIRANEAINSLSRIPKNDALRKRGFQIVKDWIRRNS